MEAPVLSVIIPVYNREKLIARCLESVVHQTFENYEIIIVDDGSTDGSVDIVKQYMLYYSDKIHLIQQQNHGAAMARNHGLRTAQGEYITFVDSDDYIELDAFRKMYDKAVSQNADIVCAPLNMIVDGNKKIIGKYRGADGCTEKILTTVTTNLYNKFISRALLSDTQIEIPDFILGEDTAFVVALMTWAKKICYLDYAYYYYELSASSLSNENIERPWIAENAEGVKQWLVEHSNPEYFESVRVILSNRIMHLYNHNLLFRDKLKEHLLQNKDFYLYANPYESQYASIRQKVAKVVNRNQLLIPQKVYINGFDPNLNVQERLLILKNSLFYEKAIIIVLCDETCDVRKYNVTQQASKANDYYFLGAFFALEKILSTGGIYVDNRLSINKRWNFVRDNEVFFSFETADSFSDRVFGATQHNSSINRIFNTLSDKAYSKELIQKAILLELEYNNKIESNDTTQELPNGVTVYGSGVFVLPAINCISLASYLPLEKDIQEIIYKRTLDSYSMQRKSKEKLDKIWKCWKRDEKQLKLYDSSISFKIGRCITYIPRKIKEGICYINSHGISYAIKRIIKKI